MKLEYYPEADALYIALKNECKSVDSKEVSKGIVLDYDKDGNVIGIDIHSQASQKVDLDSINFDKFFEAKQENAEVA
jgi:uncharacterized protein YuzE